MQSIGVFGLGAMGRPMARALIAAGYDVRGWNRSRLAIELTQGIPLVDTLADAATADVCLLMLFDSTATDAVITQIEPHLRTGQLVLDMGSSDPMHSQVHACRLAARNVGWVDAPVSGGPEGAAARTLTIMAGATEFDFALVKPLLDVLGSNVMRIGGPGAGHTLKVINQLIVGITIQAVAEALILAEKIGLEPQQVQVALKGGFADSKILQIHGTRMINRSYKPGASVKMQLKDLRLAKSLADSVSLHLPQLDYMLSVYELLMTQGDSELDHSAPHKLLGVR